MMANSETAAKLTTVEEKEREVLVRGKKASEKWKEAIAAEAKQSNDAGAKNNGAGDNNRERC